MSPTKKERRAAHRAPASKYSSRPVVPWWKKPWAITSIAAGAVLAVVVVLFVAAGNPNGPAGASATPVPGAVLDAVTKPDAQLMNEVGSGGQSGDLVRIAGTNTRTKDGKADVVYVGAEYCPYCAAERWSVIVALSRFGTFKGLSEMTSSSTDVFPDTNTFTFHGSSYTSQYVSFRYAELFDRVQQPLESPPDDVATIFTTHAQPPYTANKGGFPFLDIANRFELYGTSYSPALLRGLTWDQIASDLGDPSNKVTQAIVGNANYMTAAICISTGDQPGSVCTAPAIKALEQTLEGEPAVGSP